jgi:hypothetical protein
MMFVPYVYKQFEGRPRLEFPSFDEAVDIFFSKAQEQQVEVKKEQQEKTVIKKLDKARGLPQIPCPPPHSPRKSGTGREN